MRSPSLTWLRTRPAASPLLEPMEPRRLLAADLVGSVTHTGGTFYPGMSLPTITLETLNLGDAAAAGDRIRLVLSTDREYGNGDDVELAVLDRPPTEPVGAGQSSQRTVNPTVGPSIPSGSYHLIARMDALGAIDETGEDNNTWTSDTANIIIARAVVTMATTDLTASEIGNNTGRVRINRTGPTTAPLTVRYTLGGTAASTGGEADFEELTGELTIAAGQAGAVITVRPINDSRIEGQERVTITLEAAETYTLGTTTSARIEIFDDDGPKVRLMATDATAAETVAGGAGAIATFTITRANELDGDLAVRYTVGGTAGSGTDFEALSGIVTIPDGERSATITLTALDDREGEATETVILTLVEDPLYITVAGRRTARARIIDDEPVVKAQATDSTGSEDGTNTIVYTVSRTGLSTFEIVIPYTLGGTATATGGEADFESLPGTVTIPAGQLSARIVLTPRADQSAEPNETVILTLGAGAGYRLDAPRARATATIRDISPQVRLTASDATATETNTTTGTFTFTRTGATVADLVVNYTIGGAATAGDDYEPLGGTVTIPAGQTSATITLTPIDDRAGEGSETVILTLADGAAYRRDATRKTARVTITDNEPVVSILATDAQAGEAQGQTGLFTITRTGLTGSALTVRFTIGGTAVAGGEGVVGADYTALAAGLEGSITIEAGESSATILVTPLDDALAEAGETVAITLAGNDGYVISASRRGATVMIADDEPVVSATATDTAAGEARTDADPGTGQFTISRDAAGASDLTVLFTIGGTATGDGADYAAVTASVVIPAGQTSATVTITPVDDGLGEGDETVVLTLATSDSYTITGAAGRDRATVTIRDDEPTVRIQATDNTATEADETTATVVFTRTGTASQLESALTVLYTVEGSADPGEDYEPLEGLVEFEPGQASVTIAFAAIDDTIGEGEETIILTLEREGGYVVHATGGTATVRITDNEPVVSVTATDAAAGENGNNGTFTIRRTGSTDEAIVVVYTITGTATAGDDYQRIDGFVTIDAESASATVTVTPIYDLLTESAETVILTLAAGDGYRVDPAPAKSRATVTVANAPAVDLLAAGLTYSTGPHPLSSTGSQLALGVSMSNAGAAAAGVFRYEVRLSLNTVWGDDDDVVVWVSTQRGLEAASSTTAAGTVAFDGVKASLAAGSYHIGVRLDVGQAVTERDRDNNVWWSSAADFVVVA
ncbi:MAG: hypothetical protein IT438_12120 [Phycisphaerales bacterium]|nr:hypothetical protein [Phycisphaerales bacterium]